MTGAGGAGIGAGRACEYIIGGATGAGGAIMGARAAGWTGHGGIYVSHSWHATCEW